MIVMGRKTWNSLGIRKPLPGRTNVIISSGDLDYGEQKPDTKVYGFNSVHSFVNSELAWNASKEGEIMVIGGSTLYQQFYKRCDRIYLTTFYFDESELITPDTFFPDDIVHQVFEGKSPDWRLVDKSFALKEPNESGISEVGALFATYEKINAPLRV
jgi:dihydrofolate reductase